jgi:hypothetical protein
VQQKRLNREVIRKYLYFLVESANKLLSTGIIEYDFENLMKEYAIFLYRIIKDDKIDSKFKNEIIALNLFNKNELECFSNSMVEGFLTQMPFFKQISSINNKIKLAKIKEMQEGLSLILFKFEGYSFEH